MMIILTTVLKMVLTAFLTVLTAVAPGIFGVSAEGPYMPLNSEECNLSVVAISDTHFYEKDNSAEVYSSFMFNMVMSDLEKAEKKPDALLVAGDITDHGSETQWINGVQKFASVSPAEQILLGIGNHDTWTRTVDGKSFDQLFTEYSSQITGEKIEKVYYSTTVKGYTFIFLGSERDDTEAYYSPQQLSWLEAEMAKAAEADKPIFVVSHWPFNKTHGLPVTFGEDDYDDTTGGIGQQSDAVMAILSKYENVFFISGHIHNGFSGPKKAEVNGYESVETYGNITSINLPSVYFSGLYGYGLPGNGYSIEVYDNEVLIRARNLASGNWLPEFDYTVTLK